MAVGANKNTQSQKVADVVAAFNDSWKYAKQNHHKRWENNRRAYNNTRTHISYKGVTNTFVPLPFSIVETATAALTSGKPSIDFVPHDMYKYIKTYLDNDEKPDYRALNAAFDYFWDCDNWDLATIKLARSTFMVGTGVEFIYWDSDKPRIIPMAVRDLILDPNLSDPRQLWTNPKGFRTGRRYLTTLANLRSEKIIDPETGQFKSRYKNLNDVTPGAVGENLQKQETEMLMGAVGNKDNQVEVIELYNGERVVSVAQRTVLIEDREDRLGVHPFAINRFIANESIVYGKALLDPILMQSELLNDVTNQSVDAVTDILSPQWELDPTYREHASKVGNKPGTVYTWTPGSLKRVDKGSVSPNAFNERQNMKNEIREAVGVDQIVQGVGNDSDATATEINAQLNQAGQRFSIFVRMFEKEGLWQRAKIVYKMMLTYQKDKTLYPTMTMDGPKFFKYDPNIYDESVEPKIQLESSVKQMKGKDRAQAIESYTQLIADPTNDLWEAKKILYPKMFDLSEEELDRIIGKEKPMAPEEPMGLPPESMEAPELPMEAMPLEEPMPEDVVV
jgi:hypothetical protein